MINDKPKYFKIPTFGVIFLSLLLVGLSFFSGTAWYKLKGGVVQSTTTTTDTTGNTFVVEKTNKPKLDFYVMSFCPYGNQMESILKPIAELLGDKVDIQPHYIFDKISNNLADYCKARNGDPNQCETYVKNSNGQLKSVAECKTIIDKNLKSCNDSSNYLKIGDSLYASLHGKVEANQDVREICAYNLTKNKKDWWKFVDNVNNNCTAQNADACWEEQAKKANIDTVKVTECFNKDAASLIDKEIALTSKFQIAGSPTVLINDVRFPPENIQTALTINKKTIAPEKFRTPDAIKEALCSAFNKTPKECKTVLPEIAANNAPSGGGCGQ